MLKNTYLEVAIDDESFMSNKLYYSRRGCNDIECANRVMECLYNKFVYKDIGVKF